MSDNAIHDAERDSWRGAVAELSEMERVEACGHYWVRGTCVYCNETIDWDEA